MQTNIKNICCIGDGYVGGRTMAVMADQIPHIKVTVVDVNEKHIAAWNDEDVSQLPVYERGFSDFIQQVRGRNLFFSTEVDQSIDQADMIFISGNTSTKTYGKGKGVAADLKYVELCARQIASVAKTDQIVIEKSTLPVRTAQAIKTILDQTGNGVDFQILSNPEFLAEGTAIKDLEEADQLMEEQAKIRGVDPKVSEMQMQTDLNYLNSRREAENEVLLRATEDPYIAFKDAHAIAILTEWEEFKTYNCKKIYEQIRKTAFMFDGRRILDRKELEVIGFRVYRIGEI